MRVVLCVLLLSVTSLAQTKEGTNELSGFGWGRINPPISVETDGDLGTREWLIHSLDTGAYRVVVERGAGGPCVGPWFTVTHPLQFGLVSVQRVGIVHKLFVYYPNGTLDRFSLDTPAICQ